MAAPAATLALRSSSSGETARSAHGEDADAAPALGRLLVVLTDAGVEPPPSADAVIDAGDKTRAELEAAIATALARHHVDTLLVLGTGANTAAATTALAATEPFDLPVWQRWWTPAGGTWRRARGPWRTPRQRRLKRAFDLTLALALLLAFSPLLATIALLVRFDSPGPVLFRQPRVGRNLRPFAMLKFRSMRHAPAAAAGPPITRAGDPRVTRLGRVLRGTSLDELPQLVNVVRGEMSLIGPRPFPVDFHLGGRHFADVVPRYHVRHAVLPGLTGLAQVAGYRGMPEAPEAAARHVARRLRLDRYYVRHGSLGLDARLLLLTLQRCSWRTNAH